MSPPPVESIRATGRVVLVHWNVEEGKHRVARLRRVGIDATLYEHREGAGLRALGKQPPDAVAIDLGRLPAQGRDLGILIRTRKSTRCVPIVFVGGSPDKVNRVRKLLPDATYAEWSRFRGALRQAIECRPRDPVTPGLMDGYSKTPLPKKLGIKAGVSVTLLGAPTDFERTLGPLPDGVRVRLRSRGTADVVVLFVKSRADLNRRHSAAVRGLADGGRLWVAWPKKAAGVATDLSQATVRRHGLARKLVDYKIAAIDDTWSGLCFARRREACISHRTSS